MVTPPGVLHIAPCFDTSAFDPDSQEADFFSVGSDKESRNTSSEVDMLLSDPCRDLLSLTQEISFDI
jgi:hypothetical protein